MTNEDLDEEIKIEKALDLLKEEEIKRTNQVELLEMEGIWENVRREGKKHLNFWSSPPIKLKYKDGHIIMNHHYTF